MKYPCFSKYEKLVISNSFVITREDTHRKKGRGFKKSVNAIHNSLVFF